MIDPKLNADALAPNELRARAWKVMVPFYLDRLSQLVERFGAARLAQRGAVRVSEDMNDPAVDDVLDDLAQRVLVTGGKVVIVPADRTPADSGLAAIYCF